MHVEVIIPVLSIIGQYLQFLERLHGCFLVFVQCVVVVRVDTRTSWSERFLFLLCPNINLASLRNLVVFDFFNNGQ